MSSAGRHVQGAEPEDGIALYHIYLFKGRLNNLSLF